MVSLYENGYVVCELLKHGRVLVVEEVYHNQPQATLVLNHVPDQMLQKYIGGSVVSRTALL